MNDSLEKIFTAYFASMAIEPFTYKLGRVAKTIESKALNVSPLIFRGLDCPPMCGGCCGRHTLDWLPHEAAPGDVNGHAAPEFRSVEFNGSAVLMRTIKPYDGPGRCMHLNKDDGRCNIHTVNPLSCSFEILRFLVSDAKANLLVRTYGRGWNMPRVDGERGALCGITPYDENVGRWILGQLDRLSLWMTHFGLNTDRVRSVYDWVAAGPHSTPLRFEIGSGVPVRRE